MTREEAITVLKAFMKNPLFSEVHKAAFNIAIHDIKAYQDWNINNLILVNKDNYEPTTKNNLEVAKAIEILKADSITGYSVEDVLNARDLAIKALEQEPTIKNDLGVEYISRAELMSVLSDYYDTTVEYRSMLKEIAALPVVIQESTTKNDLPHCQYSDEEIAKSFIEDVGAVKDQLPCGEQMDFPNTFDEFAKNYGFKDKNEVYTNGSKLIPVFRVKQWLEHIQEPQTFKWCTDCREYDQEKHCCHRWSKVIRDTVEEMKKEPVIDRIRAEIKDYFSITCDGNCDNCNRAVKNPCGESVDGAWVLHIIDKYKAEQEET